MKYGQARLRAALAEGHATLERREADLEAEAADKPWLRSTSTTPTVDEVKARIEHDTGASDAGPDRDFDLSEQRRQADERLAAIRSELGLGDPPDDGKSAGGADR
ncbi:MAG: hypothetical protein WKF43_07230 [Acidimicrobiales bacterium]